MKTLLPDQIIQKEHLLALSWNIATAPKLYRELASNPYTFTAQQIISERFPTEHMPDIIRAVVLAEPEGNYDRNFQQLLKMQQDAALVKQRKATTIINKRLVQYCKKHANTLKRMPIDVAYDCLSLTVFETIDRKEIEQRYAQNQRRDFKLSIITHIENARSVTIESTDKKANLGWTLLSAVFLALSFTLLFALANEMYNKQVETITPPVKPKPSEGFPVRLIIPKIHVKTFIEHVGVTSQGSMEVPTNAINVGWFDRGPRPGENGSAVIAGHLDGEDGTVGVFADLDKLEEGDKLYVEYSNGISIPFKVRARHSYNSESADDVFLPSNSPHLNLITCDGVWDGDKKSYSKRLVVFTDMTH